MIIETHDNGDLHIVIEKYELDFFRAYEELAPSESVEKRWHVGIQTRMTLYEAVKEELGEAPFLADAIAQDGYWLDVLREMEEADHTFREVEAEATA